MKGEDEQKKQAGLSYCVGEEESERKGRPREGKRERELLTGKHGEFSFQGEPRPEGGSSD